MNSSIACIQLDISSNKSIIVLSTVSLVVMGVWSGGGGCFLAFLIFFLRDSGVKPPTLLPPDLLPHPLSDMFVVLLIKKKLMATVVLHFKKPNDNLVGRE